MQPSLRTDTWYGAGGPWRSWSPASRSRSTNSIPVRSTTPATRTPGQPLTEQGFRSTAKHMLELYSQTDCDLESVVFYELRTSRQSLLPKTASG